MAAQVRTHPHTPSYSSLAGQPGRNPSKLQREMKKKQHLLGYQPLPTRSVSPPVNQGSWLGRRSSGQLAPAPEQQQLQQQQQQQQPGQPPAQPRRPQRPGLAKPIAPGQVWGGAGRGGAG